jgi:predicted nucleic acid-binding protein
MDRLAIRRIEVDHADVISIARKRKLTTYDASYVWLAGRLRAKLVTLDKKLIRSVKTLVVKT